MHSIWRKPLLLNHCGKQPSTSFSSSITFIVARHWSFQHAHLIFFFFLAISPSIYSLCRFTYWLWKPCSNSSLLWRGSPYLLLLSLFMGASRSALAFIYDSQKGHKRGERGWSLWLLLSAIVRPCLAHPLLRAGIPSLITGHPPRCRSNAAIKAVWESGAFVQLECSAINRLRTKVINCVAKEARAAAVDG